MKDERFFKHIGHLTTGLPKVPKCTSLCSQKNSIKPKVSQIKAMKSQAPKQQDIELTLRELTLAAIDPSIAVQSNSDSLTNAANKGNMVLSAFTLATKDNNANTKCTLPEINKLTTSRKQATERRKVSFDTKCPIAKTLRKAVNKQKERERYWKQKWGPVNGIDIEKAAAKIGSKKKSEDKKANESQPLFQHMYQRYDEFLSQENEIAMKRRAFARISKKGRLSIF